MNTLVIDIGTSSMRGILFSEDATRLNSTQIKYNPNHHGDSIVEQNSDDWVNALEDIVRSMVEYKNEYKTSVDVISITSQRSSIIPIDKNSKPLMNAIMWQDTRNKELCQSLSDFNEIVAKKSGAKINTVFSGSKMSYVTKYCPEIYKNVYKFVNIPEYLIHLMSGEFNTDYTYGSRSNLMNIETCEWDDELLDIFSVDKNKLCTLKEPGSIMGYTNEAFYNKTGLNQGTPIISAGGDQQCGAIGQGAYKEGVVSIVTGTGAFMIATTDVIPENIKSNVICNYSSVKGKYIVEANVLACTSAFDWYLKNFYFSKDGNIDYNQANLDLQEAYEKNNICTVLPYFQGRSTPDWNANAKASFCNLDLSTTKEDLLKGLVEGICIEINNNIELLRGLVPIENAFISGGLTNSKIINQMQADIYGIPLYHMEDSESTVTGALMVALCSLGVYPSLDEAFSVIKGQCKISEYRANKDKENYYKTKIQQLNSTYSKLYK